MTTHAKFAPSKAHRWIPCPGSIALEPDTDGESSDYADEGTAAHFWASNALQADKDAEFYRGAEVQPRSRGKVFTCNDEFILNIQVYLDDVRSRIAGGTLLVEQRLSFGETIEQEDQFGTGDAVIISADATLLTVEDLKYGQGVQVYAKDNEQLMLYALGALETYAPILGDSVQRVKGVICQPRLNHIDEHEWTVEELREFGEKAKLSAKYATEALTEAAPAMELLNPGEKQCRWCPAKATCPALARKVAEEVYGDFQVLEDPDVAAITGDPQLPGPQRIATAFSLIDLIEGWCRAVRGEVERMVAGGMTVIGSDGLPMKLIEGKKGNRKWIDVNLPKVEGLLCGIFGPDKAYRPREVISPSVADKMLGKKRKAEYEQILRPYVTQADGKPKIALGSDPAPPYSGQASESEFSNVETET